MKVYKKYRLLGRFMSAQPYNNRLLIVYLDKNNNVKEIDNNDAIQLFRTVLNLLMFKLRNEIQKRISSYRSRRDKNR